MKRLIACAWMMASIATSGLADGYLWIAAENSGTPTKIFRYNIGTNTLEQFTPPLSNSGTINNMAYDGHRIVAGTYNSKLFAKLNAYTGAVVNSSMFTGTGTNCYEDGALDLEACTLWRATYCTNELVNTTLDGTLISRRIVSNMSQFLGLEWVGNRLFATRYDRRLFGEIINPRTAPEFVNIPITGITGVTSWNGLAYDRNDGVLYMATNGPRCQLWRIDLDTSSATFVADLTTLGYVGLYADGMGWVPPQCSTIEGDVNCDGCVDDVDLAIVLEQFGVSGCEVQGDIDRNRLVDDTDLAIVLAAFGSGC